MRGRGALRPRPRRFFFSNPIRSDYQLLTGRAAHSKPMATDELKISNAEHKSRIEKIQKQLRRRRIDALYLTNSTRILYTTGFAHISTERPLAAVIPNEEQHFFMPPHLD